MRDWTPSAQTRLQDEMVVIFDDVFLCGGALGVCGRRLVSAQSVIYQIFTRYSTSTLVFK